MGNCLKQEIKGSYEPTAEEIINYGIWLGITLPDDEDLLYIARKGLKDPLPYPWKRCKTRKGNIYYFNPETGRRESKHPCDSYYKQILREAKSLNWLRNIKPTSLLNYQISSTHDFNSKLKLTENPLNIDTLKNKTAEVLSRPNNPELEMDFRTTCSNYQTKTCLHDPPLMQAFQDYVKAYQQNTFLYTLRWDYNEMRTNLEIYNTETETKESKILKIPQGLSFSTCITQLPNGKLFCFGNFDSGITILIDVDGRIEVQPSGKTCWYSSCIYFNNSVYCFGGENNGRLTLSERFDLDRKRWIQLTPMPKPDSDCSSIIFNGNILISGKFRKLLLYSIDIDSFSEIPYQFIEHRKLLINAERLYLIVSIGLIYESEIGSFTEWKRIGPVNLKGPNHMYCSYNKGGIFISCAADRITYYYKFDLNKKLISEL